MHIKSGLSIGSLTQYKIQNLQRKPGPITCWDRFSQREEDHCVERESVRRSEREKGALQTRLDSRCVRTAVGLGNRQLWKLLNPSGLTILLVQSGMRLLFQLLAAKGVAAGLRLMMSSCNLFPTIFRKKTNGGVEWLLEEKCHYIS